MALYTHHRHKGAHHYVYVDVLLDCSDDCTIHYTHQKYKGVHHYVCVDVLSERTYD